MYLDFFVHHVYPKLDKSRNTTGEMRQVSAKRYLFATMSLLEEQIRVNRNEMTCSRSAIVAIYMCIRELGPLLISSFKMIRDMIRSFVNHCLK